MCCPYSVVQNNYITICIRIIFELVQHAQYEVATQWISNSLPICNLEMIWQPNWETLLDMGLFEERRTPVR